MAKYLIVNTNNKVAAEEHTPYEAVKTANQYADMNNKIYYVYNTETKTFKPCMGMRFDRKFGFAPNRYGRRYY